MPPGRLGLNARNLIWSLRLPSWGGLPRRENAETHAEFGCMPTIVRSPRVYTGARWHPSRTHVPRPRCSGRGRLKKDTACGFLKMKQRTSCPHLTAEPHRELKYSAWQQPAGGCAAAVAANTPPLPLPHPRMSREGQPNLRSRPSIAARSNSRIIHKPFSLLK